MINLPSAAEQWMLILLVISLVLILRRRRQWKPTGSSFGTAKWATRALLKRARMLGSSGVLIGRTLQCKGVICVRNACHMLLVGSTGSGKGRSIILPFLLSCRSSCFVFDMKSDLSAISSAIRQKEMGHRIVTLSPYRGGTDRLNPLDFIPSSGPGVVDAANSLAESMMVRGPNENTQHWNDKGVTVNAGAIAFVAMMFDGPVRNLNSVRQIVASPKRLEAAATQLLELGPIPALLGHQILGMEDKEKSSVTSTANRSLSFLDSEYVAASVASSTFDPLELTTKPTTVYLQLGAEHLENKKGLLRLWVQTIVKRICSVPCRWGNEVYGILDEASAIDGLPAIEEVTVRGRSAGVRLLLAYQSDSQVRAAFRDKPTLIYDNCSTHIYLGAGSYESAELISKRLGEQTITVESANSGGSSGYSRSSEKAEHTSQGGSSYGFSFQEKGRSLLTPSEVLTLNNDLLICFVQGMDPILARKLKYDQDPLFRRRKVLSWLPRF